MSVFRGYKCPLVSRKVVKALAVRRKRGRLRSFSSTVHIFAAAKREIVAKGFVGYPRTLKREKSVQKSENYWDIMSKQG